MPSAAIAHFTNLQPIDQKCCWLLGITGRHIAASLALRCLKHSALTALPCVFVFAVLQDDPDLATILRLCVSMFAVSTGAQSRAGGGQKVPCAATCAPDSSLYNVLTCCARLRVETRSGFWQCS